MKRVHHRGRLLALLVTVGTAALALAATARPAVAAHGGRSASAAGTSHRAQAPKKHAPAKKQKPAPGQLPLKMIWGPLTLPNGSSAFPTYHHLGVQVLELQLLWSRTALSRPSEPTNPADPAYQWPAEIAQAIGQAAEYHIAIAIEVKGTPGWANGGQSEIWAPNSAQDYANFVEAASQRYPNVRDWMIWGEPNQRTFKPMPPNSPIGPRRYALILDAAYGALKAANRSNVVIGGMILCDGFVLPPEFIRWMRLPDGKPPRLDYFGINPYSTRFPKLEGPPLELKGVEPPHKKGEKFKLPRSKVRDIDDLEVLHKELAVAYRHRSGGTPKLWISEFSISSDSPNYAFEFFVSRPVQALWLTAAFKLVDSLSYVVGLGWYDLIDQPPSIPEHLTEGLMTSEATPKPAFNAYVHAP